MPATPAAWAPAEAEQPALIVALLFRNCQSHHCSACTMRGMEVPQPALLPSPVESRPHVNIEVAPARTTSCWILRTPTHTSASVLHGYARACSGCVSLACMTNNWRRAHPGPEVSPTWNLSGACLQASDGLVSVASLMLGALPHPPPHPMPVEVPPPCDLPSLPFEPTLSLLSTVAPRS